MNKNNPPHNVCVIGSSNIDIHVITDRLKKNDSVPGYIYITPGGVGHNIAEGLGNLGVNTLFISLLSNNALSHYLVDSLNRQYVDISLSSMEASEISTYLNLSIASKEYGVNQMQNLKEFNISFLKGRMLAISSCPFIVFDLNLPENTLQYLINNTASRLICETTSPTKCLKIRNYLSQIYILKSNYIEACTLIGADKQVPYNELLIHLKEKGVSKAFITHGKNGAIAMDSNHWIWYRTKSINLYDSSGAGDFFTSCIVYGEIHKFNLSNTLEFALKSTYLKLISGSGGGKDPHLYKSSQLNTIPIIKYTWDSRLYKWVEKTDSIFRNEV